MGRDFVVTVSDSERLRVWIDMFDAIQVHVTSPIPEMAELPGFDDDQLVYMVDLALISSRQRQKLVHYLANKFGIDSAEVEAGLDEHGVPILASDCMITIHNPQKWLD